VREEEIVVTVTREVPAATRDRYRLPLLVFVLVGSAVAVGLGVYGREHEPAGYALNVVGFSGPLYVKAWLTTVAAVLAVVQLVTAGRMYDVAASAWVRTVHRWVGRVSVLLTVPVAVHCIYALGFEGGSPRVLVHSLLGCFFYGAFVVKMLVLTRSDGPRWVVPVAGGALFTAVIGLWLTSSLWVFTTTGLHL
jgi:Family of unknown function (DUF6529)